MRSTRIMISDIRPYAMFRTYLMLCFFVLFGLYFFAEEKHPMHFLQSTTAVTFLGVAFALFLGLILYLRIFHIGYLEFQPNDRSTLYLKIGNQKQRLRITEKKMWWNYIYGKEAGGLDISGKHPIQNRTSLWGYFLCDNGKTLFLNQRLMPWQEPPSGLPYSYQMEDFSNDRKSKGDYYLTFSRLGLFFSRIEIISS